ncbi:MAG TPA: TIR domain-containing protein [Candidatus Mediterraneibacter merdigallinarum]|nr:TIR domain-containing protein [Candidatus Mediterraneibacter merdigallinarum]
MPYLKNYHLLISHSWKYSHQYETIVNWLNGSPYFKWANHSVSADNPFNTESDSELQERLTRQIQGCSAIIVVSGMYTSYSKWINYEINEARRMNKPIIGIKPWGNERIPVKIQENSTALVNWNSTSLISAVRDYAL